MFRQSFLGAEGGTIYDVALSVDDDGTPRICSSTIQWELLQREYKDGNVLKYNETE